MTTAASYPPATSVKEVLPSLPLNNASKTTIPTVGFGVYKIPSEEAVSLVEQALETGYRHVDSARKYDNEAAVGQGILNFLAKQPSDESAVKRSDIFYTTKIDNPCYGYEAAKTAIAEALEKVKGLGYIDLLLIHSSHGGPAVRSDTWRALEEAYAAGTLKAIGVSNWGVKHLKSLIEETPGRVVPAVNQIELNPWLQHRDIVDYCKAHDIVVEAYAPLTRGKRISDEEVGALAAKYNKTPAQIYLRWSLQNGFVPLPKTVTPSRLAENLAPLTDKSFSLSDEDFSKLGDPNAYWVSNPAWDPTVGE